MTWTERVAVNLRVFSATDPTGVDPLWTRPDLPVGLAPHIGEELDSAWWPIEPGGRREHVVGVVVRKRSGFADGVHRYLDVWIELE